ncbi:MAG: Uma2 family endonuclease [Symploca sp. SIO2E6]|nr:Uma2 family endonuclease [Symploca sp. SIO2E6]
MSLAKELQLLTNSPPTAIMPPNEFWSDEPQLETPLHLQQIIILLTCLQWWWRERDDFFASGNISIYYEKQQIKGKPDRARGPDFFVVLNTKPKKRNSWVVWEEDNRYPNLIVEILSKKTANIDRTTKKRLYQDKFATPEYFWFHPKTLEFEGFRLKGGKYQSIELNSQGWRWSEQLGLYLGVYEEQLRYFTEDGEIVPIPTEQLTVESRERELAQQQAESERKKRELAQQQAESERKKRELAQQQLADMKALLARYRESLGESSDE